MASRTPTPQFQAGSRFTFRSPLLPFATFAEWAADIERPPLDADGDAWLRAIESSRQRLCARLQEIIGQPHVRDALFLASPGLEEQVADYVAAPDTPRARKVESALVRYVARMAGRATPFGLFSGISVGRIAEVTRLEIAALGRYERHTRLDNDYLFALTDTLTRDPEIRSQLLFWPNDSLYRSAERLRYVEARLTGKHRSHHLVRIDPDEYLDATLARAERGASADALAQALVDSDPDIEAAEAREFIDDLIDSQVLVSRLTPAVTGPEPVHGIVEQLSSVARTGVATAELAAARLIEVGDELRRLDSDGPGAEPDKYRDIARRLSPLPVSVDIARLFQVDMVKPAPEATLGKVVVAELERGIELLNRLALKPSEDPLRRFREQFAARYEDREVALLEALDEDNGIGFMAAGDIAAEPSPLLHGLAFPSAPTQGNQNFSMWHRFLARKIHRLRGPSDGPLCITRADIDGLKLPPSRPMPDAFSAMATLAAPSAEALSRGEMTLYFMNAGGPSGARLTGRFCHASSEVEASVRAHLRAEEALVPDAVFAEIVHLPEGRVGNILCRPVLRDYEIPYLGLSGAADEHLLPLSDLTVAVIGGRIELRSRRLKRRVLPRLSTAHNLSLGVGVYRFLGFLQSQGVGGASWSWGPLASLPYLPRVVSGRLVLERAHWNLSEDDISALKAAAGKGKKRGKGERKHSEQQKSANTETSVETSREVAMFRAMQELRTRFELPRFVALLDGDNELPVDLANPLSCISCAQIIKNRKRVSLSEFFPAPDELPARGEEGGYIAQVVVPFVRTGPTRPALPARRATTVRRSFAPGSEWLYVKLYAGTGTVDRLLYETVGPLTRDALAQGLADSWFFIRYRDPEHHLRVRWHGDPARLTGQLLPLVHDALVPLMDSGLLWSFQLDTYRRELERYGGDGGIELAESLFCADSDAVLDMLPYVTGDINADGRWQMAVIGTDALLDDLGFDLEQKFALMSAMRDGFGAEFHADPNFYRRIGAPFRERQKPLRELMGWDFRSLEPVSDDRFERAGDERGADEGEEDFWEDESELAQRACGLALRRRSERIMTIGAELRRRAERGSLDASPTDLAPSYVHMYINRLLRSAQRAQELIIYDYLRRLYASQRARAKKSKPKGARG